VPKAKKKAKNISLKKPFMRRMKHNDLSVIASVARIIL
jgi:hypothetical protein